MLRFIERWFDPHHRRLQEVPPASNAPRPSLRNGIYMIPSLFTLSNMGLGFFALVQTSLNHISAAAMAILGGHVLDILDGRVARWTKTNSRFGVELDSLADFLTFCVAPAFLIYEILLQHNRVWGFPVAVIYVLCGALRLARFNLKALMGESKEAFFIGLPTPAAGGFLAIFALVHDAFELDKPIRSIRLVESQIPLMLELFPAILVLLSLLMVSEIRYTTFKSVNLMKPRSMTALVLFFLVLLMIYVYPQHMIFIFYISYVSWGLTDYFILRPRRLRRDARVLGKTDGYQADTYGK